MDLGEYNGDLPATMQVPSITAARQQTYYYRKKVTKEECELLLRGKPIGTFIARNSATFPGGFCIMMRLLENGNTVTRSYLLEAVPGGIHLRLTEERVFPTLYTFIEAHCLDSLLLPNCLTLPNDDWLAQLDPALATKTLLAGTPLPPRRSAGARTLSSSSQEIADTFHQADSQRGNAFAAPCRPPKPPSPCSLGRDIGAAPARPPKENASNHRGGLQMTPLDQHLSQPKRPPKPAGSDPPVPARPPKLVESSGPPVSHKSSDTASTSCNRPPLPDKNQATRVKSVQDPSIAHAALTPSASLGPNYADVSETLASNTPMPAPVAQSPASLTSLTAASTTIEVDEVECELYYYGCMDTWAESLTECIFQTYLELVEIRAVTPNKVSFKLAGTSIAMEDKGSKHFVRRHYPIRSVLLFELDPDQRTCKVKKEKKPLSVFGMVLRKPGQDKNMCHLFAAQHVTASGIIDAVQSAVAMVTGSL